MNALRALADGPGVWLSATVAYLYLFWLLYVLIMGFYRASLAGRLTGIAKWLAGPVVLIGLAVDLLANWTIATVWFREWPPVAWGRPDLVTDRLSRYIDGKPCWQQDHAAWLCTTLLDYFDPSGVHCK